MKRLGDAELEIMLTIWAAGEPVGSAYVHGRLKGSRDSAPHLRAGVQGRRGPQRH